MDIPLVDLKAQYNSIRAEVDTAIQRVLDNTSFILGSEVSGFEEVFAAYVNARGAVGVASGTSALALALIACGIGKDDEVITVAHTFTATAEAIMHVGARPVFVDIDRESFGMDVALVEAAITPRTRALLPVHLYGHPAEMDSLLDIAERHDLYLIEDAAQAHGAEYKDRRCGSMGHLACFSFYPGKNLGAYGDAGIVTGNDERLLARVRLLRDHGRTGKYVHEEIGWGERIDALQAAILRVKLPHLEDWTEARRAHAKQYDELLDKLDLERPKAGAHVRHVYHLYVVRTPQRDGLIAHLKQRGVNAGIHYPIPLHRQPAYMKLGYDHVRLPVTEQIADEIVSLPIYPEMTGEQIRYVVNAIEEFVK